MTSSDLKDLIKISPRVIVLNALDYSVPNIKEFIKLCIENDSILELKNAKCIPLSDLKEISKIGKKHLVIDVS